MASHKTYIHKPLRVKPRSGFTLIEVMVVMGIITMIIGFTIAFDVGSLQRTAFLAESLNLATALQTARADALNNVNQKKHGVAIYPGTFEGFVIFEGDSYVASEVATRVEVPSSYRIEKGVTTPNEVVFAQLSGDTSWNGTIELKDPNRGVSSNIGINYEGRIDW